MFTEALDCSHMPQVYYPHINQYVFKNRNQIISLLIRTLVQLTMLLRRESRILWQARPSMICPTTAPHLSAPTSYFLLIPSSHKPAAQQPRNTPSTPCLGALAPAPSPGMHSRDTRLPLSQYIWASAQTFPYQSSRSRPDYLKYTQNLSFSMSLSYFVYLYTTCFHLTFFLIASFSADLKPKLCESQDFRSFYAHLCPQCLEPLPGVEKGLNKYLLKYQMNDNFEEILDE